MSWPDDCIKEIETAFQYLESDFGFIITKRDRTNMWFTLSLTKGVRFIKLKYDIMEDILEFQIRRVCTTQTLTMDDWLVNGAFFETVINFYGTDLAMLKRLDRKCVEPIRLIARLFRECGGPVLRGEEWIVYNAKFKRPVRIVETEETRNRPIRASEIPDPSTPQ